MTMQFRPAVVEFKATGTDEAGRFGKYQGYYSIFGNVDDGYDTITSGAFAKTIAERGNRIKVFLGHDWSKLIGPPPDVLREDTRGLYAEGRISLKSFWGNEAYTLMSDGALTEGSIGYEVVQADYRNDGVRLIKEAKLYEISPVPLGMNPLTEVQAVKAMLARRDGAAETLRALLQELKAGARHSAADMEMLQSIHDMAMELGAQCPMPDPQKSGEPAPPLADDIRRRLRAAGLALALTSH